MAETKTSRSLASHDSPTLSGSEAEAFASTSPESIYAPADQVGMVRSHGIELPTKALHEEKTRELFALSPNCMQCHKPIESQDDATTIYWGQSRMWQLVHKKFCAFDATFSVNPLLGQKVRTRR